MTDENLLNELKQAAMPAAPPNFRPGVTFQGRCPSEIVTPPLPKMEEVGEFEQAVRDLGYPLPEGMTLVLVEMQMAQHENFWQRDPQTVDGHTEGVGEAYTAPTTSWRYRFRVVPKSARADEDIAALMDEAKSADPYVWPERGNGQTTKVISLADFQVGKVDEMGGSSEMLARSEAALAHVIAELEDRPVDEIALLDGGDAIEGIESAPNALGTNDLHLTEQIRVWRRILWRWIEALAPLAPKMAVIGVPSNHCRNRKGKAALGPALDDWGIEVISQVSDIASVNPDAFGHVEFFVPEEHQEHVLYTLVGGQVIGLVHGHQKNQPSQLANWIKSTGRRGLAQADIVYVNHFHHLVVEAFGDMQWLFISPTNDNGSSWFTPSSGERSEPGVLTMRVDARGWFDLDPIWLGNVA